MVRKQLRKRDPIRTLPPMTATLIGYARCSTDRQDLAAQGQALLELGVAEDRIYTDHGLTGTTRPRPGPRRRARRRHAGRAETRPAGQDPRHLREKSADDATTIRWVSSTLLLLHTLKLLVTALAGLGRTKPESTEAMGTGVDTRDDGHGKAKGPGPIPIDGDDGGMKKRRLRVLVVTTCSPRPMRAVQRVSNCVGCQERWAISAGHEPRHVELFLTMAFRMVSSLRMPATKATFFALPAASSLW